MNYTNPTELKSAGGLPPRNGVVQAPIHACQSSAYSSHVTSSSLKDPFSQEVQKTYRGKILVTGGTGYIGSHLLVRLIERGYDVVALDNLSNSFLESLERVKQLTGRVVPFLKIDLLHDDLRGLFKDTFTKDITGIIHCAGLKAVGESSVDPLKYYENNFVATLRLLRAIEKYIDDHKIGDTYQGAETCVDFIFSSSAMVYGHSEIIPIPEGSPCLPTSPYGMSKLSVENLLKDFSASLMRKYNHKENVYFKGINLRYFNPVGAHPSGILGEHPHGIPNNLFPYLGQVAMGRLGQLSVFGDDYPETHDGTGIRDYIHIMDLVEGHVDALEYLQRKTIVTDMIQGKLEPCQDLNLGLGKGYSVLDMISAFEKASGQKIPFQITGRRYGDVARLVASPTRAHDTLNWSPKYTLQQMCQDFWRWLQQNPQGYTSAKK